MDKIHLAYHSKCMNMKLRPLTLEQNFHTKKFRRSLYQNLTTEVNLD
ncbi:hypothetical protein [Okeania sp. KiyG1]|nr:hypothetical protein [Okeania sp. KiyG1]